MRRAIVVLAVSVLLAAAGPLQAADLSPAQWPEAEVTPYLFQAGTDAGAWRNRGIPVFGIYPYPISTDELRRMHGNDERVSVESLRQGTEMLFRTLKRVAGSSGAR